MGQITRKLQLNMQKIKTITRTLRDRHPDIVQAGRWLFRPPIKHVCAGLLLDGSGTKNAVVPTVFVNILFGVQNSLIAVSNRWSEQYSLLDTNIESQIVNGFESSVLPLIELSSNLKDLLTFQNLLSRPVPPGAFDFQASYIYAAYGDFEPLKLQLDKYIDHLNRIFVNAPANRERDELRAECVALKSLLEIQPATVGDFWRNSEKKKLEQNKLAEFWEPAPFPFELGEKL
jgi:hypothetical protein